MEMFLTIKPYFHLNNVLMLNWNRTYIQTAFLCYSELFEIELFFFYIETVFTLNRIV